MAFTTKPSKQNFIVFLKKVQTAIIGNKSCVLLAILDKLDSRTLSDGRVRLLGFNADFFQNDAFGVRSSSKRVGLLVLLVMPLLFMAVVDAAFYASASRGQPPWLLWGSREPYRGLWPPPGCGFWMLKPWKPAPMPHQEVLVEGIPGSPGVLPVAQ
uniref:Uncharacterized protein n=1 Tax=Erpetoichthys calabaricus TaxID=27687 RepID=A0A8C4TFD9_ERPCA